MVDLNTLLGAGGMQGLLTPEQQGDVTGQSLMSLGAGLMKASGPSPYKPGMTTLSGIGDAIQGMQAGRNAAINNMLNQTLVRAKTLEGLPPLLKLQQEYSAAGIPLPENYRRVIDAAMQVAGAGGRPGVPGAPAMAAPGAAPSGQYGVTPGALPPVTAQQRFADEKGYSREAILPGRPGHEEFVKAFDEYIHATAPEIAASERQKKVMEAQVQRHEKLYPPLVALGQEGYHAQDTAKMAQALMADPNFYSGSGQPMLEAWRKFATAMGGDPNAAFPMEAFRKITASNINDQIASMKAAASEMGGSAGRIFERQASLMEKASQNLENTPAANRFLANLQHRSAVINSTIGEMATEYTKQHGVLDAGFDQQMNAYLRNNPLYKPEELANLGKVATPEGSGKPKAAPPASGPDGVKVHVNPKTGQRGYIDPKTGQWTLIP